MVRQVKQPFLTYLSPAFAACALLFLVSARYKEPLWLLPKEFVWVGFGFAASFIVGLLIIRSGIGRTERPFFRVVRVGIVGALVSWPLTVALLLTAIEFSRRAMVYEVALLFGLLLTNEFLKATTALKTGALTVNFAAFLLAALSNFSGDGTVERNESIDYVFSSLTDLKVTNHAILEEQEEINGGGIASVNDRQILVATAKGDLFLASIQEKKIDIDQIDVSSPLNRQEYLSSTQKPSGFFRVTDVLVKPERNDTLHVFATHHHWDSAARCLTLRLSEITINTESLDAAGAEWIERYETTPCLSLPGDYVPNTTGGRLDFLAPSSILMTIGIHRYDLISDFDIEASDETVSYGKIVEIDLEDWSTRVHSTGHRNPQGLLVDNGRIWSTEHGPQGGDELNVVVFGESYGWPDSTYGTKYGSKTGYTALPAGTHTVGRRPFHAWIPSIGVSNLIKVGGTLFPGWQGDLIVSSLRGAGGSGQSLFRLRIREDRVIFSERMNTGQPVRDLLELDDGRIVLWNGKDMIQMIEPGDYVISTCIGCHVPTPGSEHGIGPNLWKVVGRRVAVFDDFGYSEAMIKFGGLWTRERLDSFLLDPNATVPGTSMEFTGIQDSAQRQAIIEYLSEI